jgi:hypothetical protein
MNIIAIRQKTSTWLVVFLKRFQLQNLHEVEADT